MSVGCQSLGVEEAVPHIQRIGLDLPQVVTGPSKRGILKHRMMSTLPRSTAMHQLSSTVIAAHSRPVWLLYLGGFWF